MSRYFILQFLDSRGIDVGETPNDIILVLNETTFMFRVIQQEIRKNTVRLDC
jgi:hypothetical protein